MQKASHTSLLEYIQQDRIFVRMYELYSPNLELLNALKAKLPYAKIIVISAYWCPDCKRNVSRMARIAEYLPDWDFEVYSRDTDTIPKELGFVKIIPTFVIRDAAGKELGRIVENPKLSSLEEDLMSIAKGNYDIQL
ncbi:MAG: thioredoxin family protein [Candidatus Thorarchaeota archaeon]